MFILLRYRPHAKAAFDLAVEHQSVNARICYAYAEVTKTNKESFFSGALAPERSPSRFIAVCGE